MGKLCMLCLMLSTVIYGQTGTVVLNIEGIQIEKGGELSAGIFYKENFPKVGKQLLKQVAPVTAGRIQIVYREVPVGTYAVAVFQDIDKNQDLKTNFVGLPREPIGFSNDARIRFGPPDFGDASFKVEAGKTVTLPIILR